MKSIGKITKKTTVTTVTTSSGQTSNIKNEYWLNAIKLSVNSDEQAIARALTNAYASQGEYYQDVYGISFEIADQAQWHPYDHDFDVISDGWKQFLKDKGCPNILTRVTESEVSTKLF